MRLCVLIGHDAVDIDPTEGNPVMGGPMRITVCERCGMDLPASRAAQAWNEDHPFGWETGR